MDLSHRLEEPNPWPVGSPTSVLFILDTRNSFERDLLLQWIERHRPRSRPAPTAHTVFLNLSDDRIRIDSGQLMSALEIAADSVVAPLRVAWLPARRNLDAGPRLRDLVLGDPRLPSARRAKKIVEKAHQRLQLLAGKPDTIANLDSRFEYHHEFDDAETQRQFAKFVGRQAALVLDIAERRLRGGRYKVPRHVAANLLASPGYNQGLESLARETGKPKSVLVDEAKTYMDEMVSTPSTFWLDVYSRFNDFCLGLGYEEDIVYDPSEITALRQTVRDNPTLLLWTHKTYLDGMVVPKVLYDNDFPMPHMFGGANMNFPGIGFLIHRAGGIFIKRSFQDNELYKLTLRHYIGYLMEKRFPMNWAFEGTRSRMGKLMPPRYGLLKYVLEACHTTGSKNIHIVPITLSYDIIRDVDEYATEQTGLSKGAESLRWFIGYVRSLARPMGKVYMDVGKPVVLERAPEPDDSLALSKIAFEVAVEANQAAPITFPALVTMSLLGAAPRALTEAQLVGDLGVLLDWATARNISISRDFDPNYAEDIRGLVDILIGEKIVTRYDKGPDIVYGIDPAHHAVASYYRNTIIHFFVNKAIIELALITASEGSAENALDNFWTEVDKLRDLFKFEFFYAPTEQFHQQIRDELQRYDPNWERQIPRGRVGLEELQANMKILVAHVTLLTYAEAYSVVADLLSRMHAGESLDQQACIDQALRLGQQAYLLRHISSEASIGKLLFKNAYQLVEHRQLTVGGDASVAAGRAELSRELHDLLRRLEIIRALGVARRGRIEEVK